MWRNGNQKQPDLEVCVYKAVQTNSNLVEHSLFAPDFPLHNFIQHLLNPFKWATPSVTEAVLALNHNGILADLLALIQRPVHVHARLGPRRLKPRWTSAELLTLLTKRMIHQLHPGMSLL